MHRRLKTSLIAFLLIALLTPNLSLPAGAQTAPPLSGNFRIALIGFRVNHQTVDDALERDGVGDEVTLIHQVAVIDNAGDFRQLIAPGTFTTPLGQSPPNPARAGHGSPRGGLVTGDGYPTDTPWVLSAPIISGNPPNILFEGSLVQRANAVLIVPTIWEWDGNRQLQDDYAGKMSGARSAVTSAVRAMINGTRPLTTGSVVMKGSELGIGGTVVLGRGLLGLGEPKNRPIGMNEFGDGFGFTPQAVVLTYDVAREVARRDAGRGRGVIEVRYKESDGLLQGDYSLFIKIEDLTNGISPACAPTVASFRGTAQLTTSFPDKRLTGPFTADVLFDVQFSECRSVVSIPQFPAITTQPFEVTPGVKNTTTVTRTDTSAGSFNAATGRLTIPMTLLMRHSYSLAGDSTLSLTLSTDGGSPLNTAGNITLAGIGRFRGGFFSGYEGNIVVHGALSPNPRP